MVPNSLEISRSSMHLAGSMPKADRSISSAQAQMERLKERAVTASSLARIRRSLSSGVRIPDRSMVFAIPGYISRKLMVQVSVLEDSSRARAENALMCHETE